MHPLGGGVAGQGGRVVVGQLLKAVGFIIGTIGMVVHVEICHMIDSGFIFK